MSAILIDSNVLLDVLLPDQVWAEWSADALEQASDRSRLLINAIVYAEVSVSYTTIEDLEAALTLSLIGREPLPYEAAFLAGKAFLAYRRRGGLRTAPLPDFLIGAHAEVRGYPVLTRDPARIRSYFPAVELITPET